MSKKILVVEDAAPIRELVALNLRLTDCQVDEAESAEEALKLLEKNPGYDVAVVDVMLPGMNGFSLCESIRRQNDTIGIIILSAKSQEQDKIRGLSIGADDYMTKPFDSGELLARVRALTRRQGEVLSQSLTVYDLVLNLSTRCLSCAGKSVRLGFKEFDVLRLLMAAPKSVIPKEDIITKVWGIDSDAEDNNVEVYISFLRKKLNFLGSRVSIGTVRKVGYHLEYPLS